MRREAAEIGLPDVLTTKSYFAVARAHCEQAIYVSRKYKNVKRVYHWRYDGAHQRINCVVRLLYRDKMT